MILVISEVITARLVMQFSDPIGRLTSLLVMIEVIVTIVALLIIPILVLTTMIMIGILIGTAQAGYA